MHLLLNIAEPTYFEQQEDYIEAIALKDNCNRYEPFANDSDQKTSIGMTFASRFTTILKPTMEFSVDSVNFVLRFFIEMNCKEALTSLIYLDHVLLQSCNEHEGLKARIESFVLRLLERFSDFDLKIRETIMNIAVLFVTHFNSNEVTMKMIQTIRKSLSNSHCNKPELATVFSMIVKCNFSDQGPSQSSILSFTEKHTVDLIIDSIYSLFLRGSDHQRSIIIDHLYNEIIIKKTILSQSGQLFVDKILKCEDKKNLRIWALKFILYGTDIKSYEAITQPSDNNQNLFLVLGDLLKFFEEDKREKEIEDLAMIHLVKYLEAEEHAMNLDRLPVNTNINIFDDSLIHVKEDANNSSGGFKILCLLLRVGIGRRSLTSTLKAFLKCSRTASSSEVIEFFTIATGLNIDIVPFFEDLLKLNEVISSEFLQEPLLSWIVENLDKKNVKVLHIFKKFGIDYIGAIDTIIERKKGVHQYLAPYISDEQSETYLTHLKSIDFEDLYSLKYLLKMLLNKGNDTLWANVISWGAKGLDNNAILLLSIVNDEIQYANPKALTSGLAFIQRLVKAASYSTMKTRKSKKILETTIQSLKILTTRMNTISSFHMGNLKAKRTRVDDSL